ncbi:Splicing factor 3B subunit 4-like protein [Drosera capensis]
MAGKPNCTVYIGNLDERVTDRVLYDILIQAGRVVDLHMPRDRETNKLKGFAFAEYETDEIADYAVRLFSGLVILYNKTLKFQISGKDKPLPNMVAATNSSHMYAPHGSTSSDGMPTHPNRPLPSSRFSPYSRNSGQGREPNGNISRLDGRNFDYARRVFGASFERVTSSRLTRGRTHLTSSLRGNVPKLNSSMALYHRFVHSSYVNQWLYYCPKYSSSVQNRVGAFVF